MWTLWNKIYFLKTVFKNFMKWGLKGWISFDTDSGPLGYVLWCCDSRLFYFFSDWLCDFVRFSGNGISRKNAFDIYWPLVILSLFFHGESQSSELCHGKKLFVILNYLIYGNFAFYIFFTSWRRFFAFLLHQ